MSDPFPKKIVRERLTGSSAFYGERVRDIVFFRGIYGVLGAFLLVSPMGNTASLL